MDVLKATLSNREYEIISECALSNFSETPHPVPTLDDPRYGTSTTPSHVSASSSESIHVLSEGAETWIANKFSVSINLVELSLHSGSTRDSPLASVQVIFCGEKCFGIALTAPLDPLTCCVGNTLSSTHFTFMIASRATWVGHVESKKCILN